MLKWIFFFVGFNEYICILRKYIIQRKTCRHASGDCDLPEYCTGDTGDCPPGGNPFSSRYSPSPAMSSSLMSPFSDLYVKNGEACVDDNLDRAGLGGPVTLLPLLHTPHPPPHHCTGLGGLFLELCSSSFSSAFLFSFFLISLKISPPFSFIFLFSFFSFHRIYM